MRLAPFSAFSIVAIVLSMAGAQPIAAQGASVAGRVLDENGTPVPGAEIVVGMTVRAYADTAGAYRVAGLPAGHVTVTARRLGFQPHAVTLDIGDGIERAIDFELSPIPLAFDTVAVTGRNTPRNPRLEAFQERKAHNNGGRFLTREDIAKSGARTMSDIMRLTPGMRTNRDRFGRATFQARNSSISCPMKLFVDGLETALYGASLDDVVRVQDIEAMEVYHGVASVPPEFSGNNFKGNAACGALVIWTRER